MATLILLIPLGKAGAWRVLLVNAASVHKSLPVDPRILKLSCLVKYPTCLLFLVSFLGTTTNAVWRHPHCVGCVCSKKGNQTQIPAAGRNGLRHLLDEETGRVLADQAERSASSTFP